MRLRTLAVTGVLLCLTGACGSDRARTSLSLPVSRQALSAPLAFVRADGIPLEPSSNCYSPLYDPNDKTILTWVRSGERHGDYSGGEGKYGVAEGELLRLECGSGKLLGIVRR